MDRMFLCIVGLLLLVTGAAVGVLYGATRGAQIAELREEMAAAKRSAVLTEFGDPRVARYEARKAELVAACIEEAVRLDKAEALLPPAMQAELQKGVLGDYLAAERQLALFVGQFGQLTRDEEPRMTAAEMVADVERRANRAKEEEAKNK